MKAENRPTVESRDAAEVLDQELLTTLQRDRLKAAALLFDRYQADVNRLVCHVLGADAEHDDVVQQAFLGILKSLSRLRNPGAVRSWVVSITIKTARTELRRRRQRRWVQPRAPEHLPEVQYEDDHQARNEVVQTYRVLDKLPADERVAFVLRYIEGLDLEDVAAVAGYSLATVKRRLQRAEERFVKLAAKHPALAERLRAGGRWGCP